MKSRKAMWEVEIYRVVVFDNHNLGDSPSRLYQRYLTRLQWTLEVHNCFFIATTYLKQQQIFSVEVQFFFLHYSNCVVKESILKLIESNSNLTLQRNFLTDGATGIYDLKNNLKLTSVWFQGSMMHGEGMFNHLFGVLLGFLLLRHRLPGWNGCQDLMEDMPWCQGEAWYMNPTLLSKLFKATSWDKTRGREN